MQAHSPQRQLPGMPMNRLLKDKLRVDQPVRLDHQVRAGASLAVAQRQQAHQQVKQLQREWVGDCLGLFSWEQLLFYE